MDSLRGWAVTVCAVALVSAVLRQLFPEKSLGKVGKMLLPCVFLCAILYPLLAADWMLPGENVAATEEQDNEALQARMQQQLIAGTQDTLLKMVNQALKSYGFQAEKVVADMDIDDEGGISMGQITVYVDKDTARRSVLVKQVAEKRLGTDVVVARSTGEGTG